MTDCSSRILPAQCLHFDRRTFHSRSLFPLIPFPAPSDRSEISVFYMLCFLHAPLSWNFILRFSSCFDLILFPLISVFFFFADCPSLVVWLVFHFSSGKAFSSDCTVIPFFGSSRIISGSSQIISYLRIFGV